MMDQYRFRTLLQQSQSGDEAAKKILVEENLGLVWSVVRRFLGRSVERDDLFQLGCMGLLKAIDKFDSSFDVQFSTYAVPLMIGEIRRFLRDDGSVKVARSIKELSWRVYRARDTLGTSLGHDPTLEELANYLQVSREEIAEAVDSYQSVASLQQSISWKDGHEVTLEDRLESSHNETEAAMNRILLKQLIEKLPKQERNVIILRYYLDQTQSQVAKNMGLTQVQVSRIERKVLRKMRQEL